VLNMSAETITLQIGLSLVALMVVPALFYVFLQRRQKRKSDPTSRRKELIGTSSKKNQPKMTAGESSSDCAWEERRLRGIAAASSHEKKDASTEKPFGSSYYYAHNSTRATGGYKDGLRMEDYTMNGPRLLSRGGKAVDGEREDDGDDDAAIQAGTSNTSASGAAPSASSEKQPPITATKKSNGSSSLKRSVPISRYLWDDPGDATTAVATIRIEQLPGPRSTDPMVPWKDASVTKVHAELLVNNNDEQQGLLVTIETAATVDYELRMPKLYGRVAEVEAITKPKRLLLRLKKKKGFFDKTNLKAWPHPQKKIS